MFAIIVGCFAAVIGGAITFGLWSMLPKGWQRARSPVSVFAALCVAVLVIRANPQPSSPTPPRQTPAEAERALLTHPDLGELMAAWKETDPSAFAGAVVFATDLQDADLSEIRNDPRFLQMVTVAGRRLAYLSDDQAVERFRIFRDQMLELRQTNPALCAPVFYNRDFDHTQPPFSRPLYRRFLMIQANALRASQTAAPQAMTDAEVQAAAREISERLHATVGDDIALLSPDAIVQGKETRFCEVAAEYFNQVSLSPDLGRLNAGIVRMQHGP
ncbi:MAG: hypothetical protein NT015_15795 [Alphaproteobacteria bacterium]|nr:hypothetical protein [Alphaproteobacteria bacterium]